MIHVHLPDGAARPLAPSSSAADLASTISPSLARRTVAALIDGTLCDLSAPLPDGASVELVSRDDPRALELVRHDLAHVLAEAVQALWPGTKTAIGPAIEHGFYYDFERDMPFTPEDLPAIEKKMREIIAAKAPFTGILIEHHAGHLPLWLAPVQVVVATVTGAADGWAVEVAQTLKAAGLRVEADLRNEKIGYKVREHALTKTPVQIALGGHEAEERTVTIRRHGAPDTRTLSLEDAVQMLLTEARAPGAAEPVQPE